MSDVRARIATASEGNPLFVEQLLEMMVEEGLLRRSGEVWVAAGDLSTVPMPPTIHALLAARLESLDRGRAGGHRGGERRSGSSSCKTP